MEGPSLGATKLDWKSQYWDLKYLTSQVLFKEALGCSEGHVALVKSWMNVLCGSCLLSTLGVHEMTFFSSSENRKE